MVRQILIRLGIFGSGVGLYALFGIFLLG